LPSPIRLKAERLSRTPYASERLNVKPEPSQRPDDKAAATQFDLAQWIFSRAVAGIHELALLSNDRGARLGPIQTRASLTEHFSAADVANVILTKHGGPKLKSMLAKRTWRGNRQVGIVLIDQFQLFIHQ